MPVTLLDIAKRTGLTKATVSRVLNQKSGMVKVSTETRERVMRVAKELNYRPSFTARSLANGRTYTLGFLCGDFQSPYLSELAMMVMDAAESRGYHLLVSLTKWDEQKELSCLDSLLDRRVDGILMMTDALHPGTRQYDDVIRERFPLVVGADYYKEFPGVVVDWRPGMLQAVEYLKNRGHRRVGMVQLISTNALPDPKVEAFREACQKVGVEPVSYTSSTALDDARRVGAEIAADPHRPSAVISVSDYLANGLLYSFLHRGLRVPQDIALVGVDGTMMGGVINPPLTSIAVDIRDFGTKLVDLLLERVNDRSLPPQRVFCQTSLLVRESA